MLIQSQSGDNYLTFNDEEHSYTLNGKLVEGVTSILKNGLPTSHTLITWMCKQSGWYVANQLKEFPEQVNRLPNYLLDEIVKKSTQASRLEAKKAADIGSIVHDYVEAFEAKNEQRVDELIIDIANHPDEVKIMSCIKNFADWKKENEDEIIGHEEIIGSPTYNFAGKFDCLRRRGNRIILSDYKTSGGIYISQFIQLAAYSIALEEWKGIEVDGLEILRFGKTDAKFETQIVTGPKKVKALKEQFLRCLDTYRFMKEVDK